MKTEIRTELLDIAERMRRTADRIRRLTDHPEEGSPPPLAGATDVAEQIVALADDLDDAVALPADELVPQLRATRRWRRAARSW